MPWGSGTVGIRDIKEGQAAGPRQLWDGDRWAPGSAPPFLLAPASSWGGGGFHTGAQNTPEEVVAVNHGLMVPKNVLGSQHSC